MKKEMPKIRVIDIQTEQILFECSMDDSEKAYEYAARMEEMGLDVKVDAPTLGDTLSQSLGLSKEAQETYRQSMQEELEEHEGSCCFEDINPTKH